VGQNMCGTPGIAGKTFNAMGKAGVNLIAIAQGSSETNISFVIKEQSVVAALQCLHQEFGLNKSAA
jgi:aspartokinase